MTAKQFSKGTIVKLQNDHRIEQELSDSLKKVLAQTANPNIGLLESIVAVNGKPEFYTDKGNPRRRHLCSCGDSKCGYDAKGKMANIEDVGERPKTVNWKRHDEFNENENNYQYGRRHKWSSRGLRWVICGICGKRGCPCGRWVPA